MFDSRDSLIALLKEKYDHEYNRKKYFEDTLQTPITLFTGLVGGIYLVLNDNIKDISPTLKLIWIFILFVLIICSITSFYFLYKAYVSFGDKFNSFPKSLALVEFYNKSKEHFVEQRIGSTELEDSLDNSLKNEIINWYVDANEKNWALNEKRAEVYINARKSLGISLSLGIVLFIFISITKLSHMSNQPKNSKKENVQPAKPVEPKKAPVAPKVVTDKYSADSSKIRKV